MVDYNKVKPGFYLQQGGNLKSLNLGSADGWGSFLTGGSSAQNGLNALAATVVWLHISRLNRQEQMIKTPFKWVKNGKEVSTDETPFGFDEMEFARIDWAKLLHNNAYYHRAKGRGSKSKTTVSLAWLNPACVKPDNVGFVPLHGGYTHYRYSGGNLRLEGVESGRIPADDLLKFEGRGMSELWSDDGAGKATRLAAKVLHEVEQLSASSLGNNAMPVYLVHIPETVTNDQDEIKKLTGRFRDAFNRVSSAFGSNKTIGVPDGVTVTKLSLTPAELNLTETEAGKYKSVLAAYGVPLSNVDPASNFATKKSYDQGFALSVGYSLKWIAKVINNDPAFKSQGYRLVVEPEKLAINLEDEQRRSEMYSTYRLSGMSEHNAMLMAGLSKPEEWEDAPEIEPVDNSSDIRQLITRLDKLEKQGEPLQVNERVNEMDLKLEDEAKKAVKFHRQPRNRPFESDVFSSIEIESITGQRY